jgi:ABC-type nitrate/sulfonate/bicarbonate transport system permease component
MRSSEWALPRLSPELAKRAVRVATIVGLLVLWEASARAGFVNEYSLPRPSRVAATLWSLMWVGYPIGVTVWEHIWATLWRIIRGYALATSVALPLGLVIGGSRFLDKAVTPIITFARSIAIISLLPLFVLWFGAGELSKVLLIAYGCFWIMITNVIAGVKQVSTDLIRAALMLGVNHQQLFFRVVLPASIPRIFAGMKVALGVAFAVIVAVEMIGTSQGLGALIEESRYYYRSDVSMVGIVFIALFGFSLSVGLDRLETILLPWARGLEEVQR